MATYDDVKTLAVLTDLAARNGWELRPQLPASPDVMEWERGGHRVEIGVTAAGRLKWCGHSSAAEPDPLNYLRYANAGGDVIEVDMPKQVWTTRYWRRKDAGKAGLGPLVRQWLSVPAQIAAGDEILVDKQWCPVTAVAASDVTAMVTRKGRTVPHGVPHYEIAGHRAGGRS